MGRYDGRLPDSYQAAEKILGKSNGKGVPGVKNTRIYRVAEGGIAIEYYLTDIATFYPSGVTCFNTGGYGTVSTKERLNAMLPAGSSLVTRDYVLTLLTPEGKHEGFYAGNYDSKNDDWVGVVQ